MNDNFKNKLQEYCMKKKISLPVYDTEQYVDQVTKKNLFKSKVTVLNESCVSSDYYNTKVDAEKNAAQLLFELLQKTPHSNNNNSNHGIYIFDLENMHTTEIPNRNQIFIGFISSTHSSLNNYNKWKHITDFTDDIKYGYCYIIALNNFGLKDMIDHYISAYTYKIALWYNSYHSKYGSNIYIISRDKSAWCNKICLELWLPKCKIEIKAL